jgi:hypothetical protein
VLIEKLEDMTLLSTAMPKQVPLIVLSRPLTDTALSDIQRYVSRGGRLLVILDSTTNPTEMSAFLAEVLGLPDVHISSLPSNEYAMLAEIDFQNPLLLPFADPRFNDFTKIQFWSHRQLTSSHEAAWLVVARFDDGFPAIVEKQIENGRVWVMTSGWQPEESRLALSSKFIPLLHGFFGHANDTLVATASYEVGQKLKLTPTQKPTTIIGPSGEVFAIPEMSESFGKVSEPGIYEVQQGEDQFSIAVNLSTDESRTKPLLPDRLEQIGLQLGKQKTVTALRKEQRQMRNKELEGRQKLWRLGILAALVAVAIETGLSGRANQPAVSEF